MLGPTITVAFSVATLPIFAVTLAARSEYAPVESRVQVFIWVGALKIAAGSAGTAAAGATTTHAAWVPLVVVSALTVAAATATASIVDRSRPR
ncbi:hypothetical protein CIK52_13970 [Kocuria rosea]|jgi:hypothetical protein|uniref:hypothetical protein n=1 Tax=Kocuria rosea TaxID=1275 RepID=UPI000D64CC27|nr:hypothetical protein [Kocuria rosea]PWF83679.1 hypothetical protein CIK52_13970 [Kocuria rosea]QCY33003.1 hypothetical protein EQG70_09090 [Kocuria rosea]TQN33600.1 hypothetical protein FHX38_3075 [Kocuria rosea]STX05660.1 Uncharacterised protein [Kocuria rosea]